ncbi:NADP-dependent isocitrate dehydrogenase [Loigolactobacillus binensis]|uniref:Isocitrate dehydrogenase [NADP] n=1 Tax=Loigolactobacillus binensis TaxID=2559922 RepID=A0ABW3EG98_9LACO|nr:NADP-dependent isocitrate dehydrogenase [Loigolactobacillus binensis]
MTTQTITKQNGQLKVPAQPLIPFIAGDGIGPEIWAAAQPLFDAAVASVYGSTKAVQWLPLLAGAAAFKATGEWLPAATLTALKENLVAIKGPLTTPIGGGHRSLNVTLRQKLDLYACFRPIHYFAGTPSPLKQPEKTEMVVFRENTEDIYAGIEYAPGAASQKLRALLAADDQLSKVRFPTESAFALKPISKSGSQRLVKSAIDYALAQKLPSVTLVHKGNIMKLTEGGFKKWGYAVAADYADQVFTWETYRQLAKNDQAAADAAYKAAQQAGKLIIKDVITDNFFQQALLAPEQFAVVATPNLNGDYISDALAAQVGGIGIAPGANINYETGAAIFEATHGTAPQFAGQNKLNPTSLILSGALLFDYIGWPEVAAKIRQTIAKAIKNKQVTWDFATKIPGATQLSTSDFGAYLITQL